MSVKKTLWALLAIAVSCAASLWAGDTATFVDLGFSPDGRTYAFAQYGVQSGTLRPWAELFVVDVPQNNFVSGGRVSFVHDRPIAAGQDGSGALYNIVTRNSALTTRYGVNFLNQGQPLFISLDEPSSPPAYSIEFRDFNSSASYRATIVPTIEGSGASLTSSFQINLERTAGDGSKRSFVVGSPSVKRPQIVSYRMRKVLISPNSGSLIFIIEMRRQNGPDYDTRFMVEALRF
jgi:predicted secreted protein